MRPCRAILEASWVVAPGLNSGLARSHRKFGTCYSRKVPAESGRSGLDRMERRTVARKLERPSIRERPVQYTSSSETPDGENSRQSSAVISVRNALELHFKDRPDVFVSGRLAIWYQIGWEFATQPDVLVTLGAWRGERGIYCRWFKGKVPDFVLDVIGSGFGDRSWDLSWKFGPQEYLDYGVREFVLYDPGYDERANRMAMCRLQEKRRVNVSVDENGEFRSEVLGLAPAGDQVRVRDLKTGKIIPSLLELDAALATEREARKAEERERRKAETRVGDLEALLGTWNQR